MKSGRVAVGHPVDVASGAQFTAAHDLEVWGCVPLIVRRYYSTALLGAAPSTVGLGWRLNLEATLLRDLDGYRFLGHDGSDVTFDDPDDRLARGGRLLAPGDFMELRREGERLVVLHWHDLETDVQRFVFRDGGDSMPLERLENPARQAIVLDRDREGRLTAATQSVEGRCAHFEYDDRGRVARVLLSAPGVARRSPRVVATFTYDAAGHLLAAHDALGAPTTYAYDPEGRLRAEVGRGGGEYVMRYDPEGRCIEVTGAGGRGARRFQWHDGGRLVEVTDGLGHTTLYECNAYGQVEREVRPDGAAFSTRFDAFGRVIEEHDLSNGLTAYAYDERGNTATIAWATGVKRAIEYDDDHQPTGIVDPDGARWSLAYERGALVRVTDPEGVVTCYGRGPDGAVTSVTTPGGNVVSITRDREWSVETAADAIGVVVERRLDVRLDVVEVHDSRGPLQTVERDALGRIVASRHRDGTVDRFVYDAEGRPTEWSGPTGATTRIAWSPYGDCLRVSTPSGSTYALSWDLEGRLTAVTDPMGRSMRYERDVAGNLVTLVRFDSTVERAEYGPGGRLVRILRGDNARVDVEYDVWGEISRMLGADGEVLYATARDEVGRVVEMMTDAATTRYTYDRLGRVVSEEQNGLSVVCSYGPHGSVVRRAFQGGRSGPIVLDYDLRGRLTALGDGSATLERFEYDDRDRMVRRWMGATLESLELDDFGALLGQSVAEVVTRRYAYDARGSLLHVADTKRPEQRHVYDPDDRLIATMCGARTMRYAYDAAGDLRERVEQVEAEGSTRRVWGRDPERIYDACGRLSLFNDAQGRHACRWDALDRLVAVEHADGSTTRFGYDGAGRRVFKEHLGHRTEYYWSGDDLVCERSPGRVIDHAIDGAWPHLMWLDGRALHAVVDPRGVVHELLDEHGALAWHGDYDDWGALARASGDVAMNLRLPGQIADPETGLHYNRYRYYDPTDARFISPDPLGVAAGFNPYRYGPNTYAWSDPLGLTCGAATSGWSVYVLTKGKKPPKVVYVGITKTPPHVRLSVHRNQRPTSHFDAMTVIQTGIPLDQRKTARNHEGSLLHHLNANPGGLGVPVGTVRNAPRQSGGYWHGYRPGDPARPITPLPQSASTLQNGLQNPIITLAR